MCDRAFPDRDGWFSEFYAESRTWIATPPWFRQLGRARAASRNPAPLAAGRLVRPAANRGLRPREILTVNPGVTDDEVGARLAARLERQAILTRDDPPTAWFLVDEAALRRHIGPPEVMAAQLAHLAGVARLPNVTIQVVASTAAAPGLLGSFALTERAAYVETAVAGQVFEDADPLPGCSLGSIRSEAKPAEGQSP